MTNDEIIQIIVENTQRSKSNSHRIDDLERNAEILNNMVSSLKMLASNQRNMALQIDKIDDKLTRLEEAPTRRWQTVLGYIVASFCSAGIGMILSNIF